MDFITGLLTNASLKRAAVGAVAAGIIALNKKLGLNLEATDIAAITTLAIAFIGQSALKEVKLAGTDAAAKVTTTKEAIAVINEVKP